MFIGKDSHKDIKNIEDTDNGKNEMFESFVSVFNKKEPLDKTKKDELNTSISNDSKRYQPTQNNNIQEDTDIEKTQERFMENKTVIAKLQDNLHALVNGLFEKTEEIQAEKSTKDVAVNESVQEEIVDEQAEIVDEAIETSEDTEIEQSEVIVKEIVESEDKTVVVSKLAVEVDVDTSKFESAIVKVKQELESLKNETVLLENKKQEQIVEADKNDMLSMVKKELSFMQGTVETNSEMLYELKQNLSVEQFNYITKNFKAQSAKVEESLEAVGQEVPDAEDMTADDKLKKIAKGYQKEDVNLDDNKAYRKALDKNPDLANIAYTQGTVKEIGE